jgi:Histidine kinase-like ATPase domain
VVSELMTNALRHAVPQASMSGPRPPLRLGLLQPGACVLCAVADPSDQVPTPRDPGQLDETGRGLYVIASLSDDWGCTTPGPLGKVVWATFLTGPDWLPAPPLAGASLPLASAPLRHRPPCLAASQRAALWRVSLQRRGCLPMGLRCRRSC